MNTREKTKWVAAVAFVLAIAASMSWVRTRDVRRESEDALRILAASRMQLEKDIRATEARLAKLAETARPAAGVAAGAAATPKSVAPAKPASVSAAEMAAVTAARAITETPGFQVLELRSARNNAMLNYGDLFRQLGLSEARIAKFGDNYAAWQERRGDLMAVMRQQDEAGKRATAELLQRAQGDLARAQAELLGEEGYRRLREYDRTLELRSSLIRGFAGGAALAGIPLTAEQSERLLAAGIESAPEGATLPAERLLPAIDWEAFDTKARQILTPAQFQYFMNETPNAGSFPHWKFRLDAAIAKARQMEAAAPTSKPAGTQGGQ